MKMFNADLDLLNEIELKECINSIVVTGSDCYIITKEDKNSDCIIIYDENIPILFLRGT